MDTEKHTRNIGGMDEGANVGFGGGVGGGEGIE